MMGLDLRNYYKATLVGIVFVFLHSLRYFDFVGVDETTYGRLSKLLALLLIVLVFVSKGPRKRPAWLWMIALLVVPVLSFLPAWIENGQSPIQSLNEYLPFGLVLVYFLLHKAKVSTSELLRILTVLALVRIGIYVIQQFTYPSYLFTYRQEGVTSAGVYKGIEVRSGIFRYYIEDTYLSMFLVFYYLQETLKNRKSSDLILFIIGLIGVYLDQSRQFMAATFVAVVVVLFFATKMRYKGWLLLGLAAIAAIILLNFGYLFEDLIDMTSDDISSDNIRLLSYTTYGLELWGGPLSILFGNGIPGKSAYGEQIRYYCDELNLYYNDIGIVGAAFLFGIVTVLLFLAFMVFFVFRNWRKLQMHLKMYYIAMLVYSPLVTIYTQNINWFVFFGFMLYLSDCSIMQYDRRMRMLRKSKTDVAEAKA